MDLRKLKTLIDLVSDSNISELEITEAEGKVRIVKTAPVAAGVMTYAQPMMQHMQQATPAPAPAPAAPVVPVETGHVVKSPMVGTFYRANTPGAKPLADVGQQVKVGEALCIIEAMKIMNEIDSDKAGTVTKVLVDNGQAVEYGQPLFIIE
jgi:acetyl-CoA carboxylase biotin carboxyl carrier protein